MIVKTDLDKCREMLKSYIGQQVRLTSNGGRKRIVVREGIVDSCYPNVFTVRCPRGGRSQELLSYSYVDVLTSVVEVSVNDPPGALSL